MRPHRNSPKPAGGHRRQRGAVAIMVGASLAVLIGMFGLAVDSGRLYINKSELQSAADACALAAVKELNCQPGPGIVNCPTSFLQAAETAGIFAGARNRSQLQSGAVTIAAADVRFSMTLGPNSGYQTRGAANPNSRFAMCIARANGIVPWVMGLWGAGSSNVAATGVATLAPGQTFCSAAPLGVCRKPGGAAPNFGYAVGEWIVSTFTATGGGPNEETRVDGSFQWVDYTPSAGGTDEVRDQLYGTGQVCGLRVGTNVDEPGAKRGAKHAYNTRFGVYSSAAAADGMSPTTAPPDRTGYGYPNRAPGSPVIAVGTSAYADYVRRQGLNSPFVENQLNIPGQVVTGMDTIATAAQYVANGTNRRLIPVPMVDCTGTTVPILGMACILMLNPMSKGNNGPVYLEYRGNASDPSSPCYIVGLPGGGSGDGPLVPTLVQ